MKRIILILGLATLGTLAVVSPAGAQASSVPNIINFQGKLTDNSGNPVADGAHNFTFRIFDNIFSITPLWSEGPLAITTTGGLLNHQLGTGVFFPQTLFMDYPELYLEIEVDGEVLSGRTQLISTPYTRLAGGLEVRRTNNDTVVVRTIPDAHQISTYGGDGKEQIRLYGISWGQIELHDSDPTNDLTALLTANSTSGGELELRDDNGALTIDLHGGLTGDASVSFPTNAINALEIEDEPGAASTLSNSVIALDGTYQNLLSRSITVPAAGYVLVIGSAEAFISGGSGDLNNIVTFGVSDLSYVAPFTQNTRVGYFGTPSENRYFPVTVHGLFSVAAGTTTFYFAAQEGAGTVAEVTNLQLTLLFIPTSYGTVTPTLGPVGQNDQTSREIQGSALNAFDIAAERSEAEKFNAERIERELAQVRSEMEARMQKLEAQLQQSKQKIEE